MLNAKDSIRLRHILEAAEKVVRFCQGRQRSDLEKDELLSAINIQNPSNEIKLGKYLLGDRIGEGSFGVVYKAKEAQESDNNTFYAIKVLKPSFTKKDFLRFNSEVHFLENLHHKSLPQFIDKGLTKPEDGFAGTCFCPRRLCLQSQKILRRIYYLIEFNNIKMCNCFYLLD